MVRYLTRPLERKLISQLRCCVQIVRALIISWLDESWLDNGAPPTIALLLVDAVLCRW